MAINEAFQHYEDPEQTNFWGAVANLAPHIFALMESKNHPAGCEMAKFVKFGNEFPLEEFDKYKQLCADPAFVVDDADEIENPALWWTRREALFPSLSKIAVFLLWVPPSVTSCDSVFSVENALFSGRQSRLSLGTAAGRLQSRANGDFANKYTGVYHRYFSEPKTCGTTQK